MQYLILLFSFGEQGKFSWLIYGTNETSKNRSTVMHKKQKLLQEWVLPFCDLIVAYNPVTQSNASDLITVLLGHCKRLFVSVIY